MNHLITALIASVISIGISFVVPSPDIWDKPSENFGATNFPASLDSLTNPGATDSVATVSHSSQHANANDAIEAIEGKVGITASTPVSGTLFAGNGTGSSIWTLYPTSTNLTATSLGTFGNLLSLGSSTIVGSLNITGNSTTTNATSSIFAATTHSTSTKWYGGGLTDCTGGAQALRWTGGFFSCGSVVVSASLPATYATSTGTTSYKVEYVSMTSGDQLMMWTSCDRTAENNALTLKVRPSINDVAGTTTIANTGADNDALFGLWTATTTYTLIVETTSSSCDSGSGLQLMTLLINN